MIIGNFDVMDITIKPTKDNSELIVNPNRMKSRQIAFQCFESIARRKLQVLKLFRAVQGVEPEYCSFPNCLRNTARRFCIKTIEQIFSTFVGEVDNHVTIYDINVTCAIYFDRQKEAGKLEV